MPAATNAGRFQYAGRLGFMQTDPIGYGAGMNMYAYVRGDAVNLRDPSGLDDQIIGQVTVTGSRDWERELEFLLDLVKTYNLQAPLLQFDRSANGGQTTDGATQSEALAAGVCGEKAFAEWLLFNSFRKKHPENYKRLGEPSLFFNNSISKSMDVVRFLIDRDYLDIPDPRAQQLGARSRGLFVAALSLFVVSLLAFVVVSATF